VQYIEVKSSALDSLHMFYITPRELEAAARFKSQYTVARVYGCPGASSRPELTPSTAELRDFLQAGGQLAAGQLPRREPAQQLFIKPGTVTQMTHQQIANLMGRSGRTRVLFLQDPIELMKMKLLKLALQL
jgi:hypothetical protein